MLDCQSTSACLKCFTNVRATLFSDTLEHRRDKTRKKRHLDSNCVAKHLRVYRQAWDLWECRKSGGWETLRRLLLHHQRTMSQNCLLCWRDWSNAWQFCKIHLTFSSKHTPLFIMWQVKTRIWLFGNIETWLICREGVLRLPMTSCASLSQRRPLYGNFFSASQNLMQSNLFKVTHVLDANILRSKQVMQSEQEDTNKDLTIFINTYTQSQQLWRKLSRHRQGHSMGLSYMECKQLRWQTVN